MREHLQAGIIVVDVVLVVAAFAIGTCLVPMVGLFESRGTYLVAVGGHLLLLSLAFLLSSVRAPRGNRWPHLLCVAGGAWACGLPLLLIGMPFTWWASLGAYVLCAMAIGAALSMRLARR